MNETNNDEFLIREIKKKSTKNTEEKNPAKIIMGSIEIEIKKT